LVTRFGKFPESPELFTKFSVEVNFLVVLRFPLMEIGSTFSLYPLKSLSLLIVIVIFNLRKHQFISFINVFWRSVKLNTKLLVSRLH
jgi:hypothetical protein